MNQASTELSYYEVWHYNSHNVPNRIYIGVTERKLKALAVYKNLVLQPGERKKVVAIRANGTGFAIKEARAKKKI